MGTCGRADFGAKCCMCAQEVLLLKGRLERETNLGPVEMWRESYLLQLSSAKTLHHSLGEKQRERERERNCERIRDYVSN